MAKFTSKWGTKVFHGENQSWPTRRAEHVGALGSLRITREGDWIPQGLQEAASGGVQAVMLPAAVGEPSVHPLPRGCPKLTPMHPTTCIGNVVHTSELGAAPRHLIPRTARFMGLLVRIHGSRSPMPATTVRGHQTCRKKLSDVSWT